MTKLSVDDTDFLWDSLRLEAETVESKLLEENSFGVPRRDFDIRGRFVGLYLSGFFPILVLLVLCCSLASSQAGTLVFLGGAILSLPIAWIFASWSCGEFGFSPLRFALMIPLMAALVPLYQLFSYLWVQEIHLNERVKFPTYFEQLLAELLQEQYQLLIRPQSLLLIGIALLSLAALGTSLRRNHPWFEFRERGFLTFLPGLLSLAFPLVALAPIFSPFQNPVVSEWLERTEPSFSKTLLGSLPKTSDSRHWRELYQDFRKWRKSGRDLAEFKRIESKALASLQESPPTSRTELAMVSYLFSGMIGHFADLDRPLEVIEVIPSPRFRGFEQRNGLGDWTNHALPWLGEPQRTKEELQQAKTVVRRLLLSQPTSLEEMDLRAYYLSQGQGRLPQPPLFTIDSPRGGGRSRTRSFRPRPLDMWGLSLDFSPTLALDNYRKRKFLETWLQVRPNFVRSFKFMEREKPDSSRWSPKDKLQSFYGKEVFNNAAQDVLKRILESTLVYIDVLRYKMEKGSYPETLDSIADSQRWSLERSRRGFRLHDSQLHEPYRRMDCWRLPE